MFGLGAWEIGLILLVALIFVGPKKLPEVAAQIGRTVRDLQRTANDFTREITNPAPEPRSDDTPPRIDPYADLALKHKEPPGPDSDGEAENDADAPGDPDTELEDFAGYPDDTDPDDTDSDDTDSDDADSDEDVDEESGQYVAADEDIELPAPPDDPHPKNSAPTLPEVKPAAGAVAHAPVVVSSPEELKEV
ncbi:MAG: TatA/E family protein of Tat protein translocase [Myxococcota bacterium]|jgi:TatA/E family protein of Tat protein translocase